MLRPTQQLFLMILASLFSACGAFNEGGGSSLCAAGGQCKVYVTTSIYGGNLGGVAGADRACQTDLNKPVDGQTYKAFLSDGSRRVACTTSNCRGGQSEHLDWVLYPGTQYVREDGSLIAVSNISGIWLGGQISDYVNTDHDNNKSTTLLTGMSYDFTSIGNNCTGWTTTGGSAAVATSAGLQLPLFGDVSPCSQIANSIVCVQQ
jgi:hypothetical protein